MSKFHFLPIEEDTLKPELKTIFIDTTIGWTPRPPKQQSPAFSFREAEKAETLDEKEALVENGIIELISDTPQIRLKSLIDQTEHGFDMLVGNRIRRNTLGNVVAVDIRPGIDLSDIGILARNAQKVRADGAWVFSTEMVSDEIKEKANESKIMVFDTNDLKMFKSGGHFVSFLRSYETPFMGANSETWGRI